MPKLIYKEKRREASFKDRNRTNLGIFKKALSKLDSKSKRELFKYVDGRYVNLEVAFGRAIQDIEKPGSLDPWYAKRPFHQPMVKLVSNMSDWGIRHVMDEIRLWGQSEIKWTLIELLGGRLPFSMSDDLPDRNMVDPPRK